MKDKVILDLCGGTGAWSRPYREAGYTVHVITLPQYDVTKALFIDGHGIQFPRQDVEYRDTLMVQYEDVYGILAAPECTQFSLARTTAKIPRNLGKGMVLVEACLKIIWRCRIHGKPAFWALENPVGYLRQFLGKPALTFQPCDYGDLHTKKTDLWGYFKQPRKNPVEIPDRVNAQLARNNRLLPELPEGYKPAYGRTQAARRAITPAGFANAFFKANR